MNSPIQPERRLFLRAVVFGLGLMLIGFVLVDRPKVSEAAFSEDLERRLNAAEPISIQDFFAHSAYLERLVKELAAHPEILEELPRSVREDLVQAVHLYRFGDRDSLLIKLVDLYEKESLLGQALSQLN